MQGLLSSAAKQTPANKTRLKLGIIAAWVPARPEERAAEGAESLSPASGCKDKTYRNPR